MTVKSLSASIGLPFPEFATQRKRQDIMSLSPGAGINRAWLPLGNRIL